jgi:phage terminase large subunit-like protein
VAALYEQGRVHHAGRFDALEDQMCAYLPGGDGPSPDRVDALVWALTALADQPAAPLAAPVFVSSVPAGGGDGWR